MVKTTGDGVNKSFCADKNINEISKILGVAVLNSRVQSAVIKMQINGQTICKQSKSDY